jgi:indole-3-glycerol phosphate synthase
MTSGILGKILAQKRLRIEDAKGRRSVEDLRNIADKKVPRDKDFVAAITRTDRTNIIAEFKRASPSKGWINEEAAPENIAAIYETVGAAAISVLTEGDFFKGSLDDLKSVKNTTQLPVLRKDFIFDEYQIYESAAFGADAILLIVSALTKRELIDMQELARENGLAALIEVHDRNELDVALETGAKVIGVNNRALDTFKTSLDVSREMIKHVPKEIVMVAESGISTREEIKELQELGYSAFLIGESLMRSSHLENALKTLLAG